MDSWIAFAIASTIILVIPGPTIILVMSQSIKYGPRAVVPLVAGVLLGDLTAMTFSLLGLGVVLSTSYLLFSLFKWIGALYLIYLGVKMWVTVPLHYEQPDPLLSSHSGRLFRGAFIVTALNPKSIAFFIAFFPQFIHPHHPVFPQLFLLGATFLTLAGINAALYGIFGGGMKHFFTKRSVRKWINRAGGSALIGAGVITAAMRRT